MSEQLIRLELTEKQALAMQYLQDEETEEILFGGGAGGGKSVLGCRWHISSALSYPETRWLVGGAVLKHLKESTAKTMLDQLKKFNLKAEEDYHYNEQAGYIRFFNGSEIVFVELEEKPSDPDFDRIGSTEYTGAFLDEISRISHKAKEVVATRLRYKHKEYNLKPKMLLCTNPCKHWAYYDFYRPWKEQKLPKNRKFIQSLVGDNPHLPTTYITILKGRDKATKERLLFGNWEYDDDPARLMDYDAITDIFTNTFVGMKDGIIEEGEKYLIADLAMQGRDRFIVSYWNGMRGKIIHRQNGATGKEIEETIKKLAEKYNVPRSHICTDSDGLGNYLSSYLEGIKPFHGGETANNSDEFANKRAECYFKLAEVVNKRQIYLECEEEEKEEIIAELEQVKRKDIDKDETKKRIVPKDEIKEMLGRSPDYADVLMMRMHYETTLLDSAGIIEGDDSIL